MALTQWKFQVASGVAGGGPRTFSEWGLSNLSFDFKSQAPDRCVFDAPRLALDADPLFAYDDELTIFKESVQWFVGRVRQVPRRGTPAEESQQYVLEGPWVYFDDHEFQRSWTSFSSGASSQLDSAHLLLNANDAGQLVTTKAQIDSVLDYILGLYPVNAKPFQKGNILDGTALYAPIHEVRDLTAAQVLRHELQFHPDAVIWFDYSTSPPTFHIVRERDLAAVNLALPADGSPLADYKIEGLAITPRHDLQRSNVVIRYETTDTFDGETRFRLDVDAYPPGSTGRERGALDVTIDLQGIQQTTLEAQIVAETIDVNSLSWWGNLRPILNWERLKDISLSFIGRKQGSLNLPRRLVHGAVASWMGIQAEEDTFTAKLSAGLYDRAATDTLAVQIDKRLDEIIELKLNTTDAPAGETVYRTVETFEAGDPRPQGLALFMWEALSPLRHSGTATVVEKEVSNGWRIGQALNVTGGRVEWGTMRALIQQVSQDVETGRTRISFGPAEHLSIPDLVELLKVGRRRLRWTNPNTLTSGKVKELSLGKNTSNDDGSVGHGGRALFRVVKPGELPDALSSELTHILLDAENYQLLMERKGFPHKIKCELGTVADFQPVLSILGNSNRQVVIDLLEINDVSVPAASRVLRIREASVCVNGESKKALVLMGLPY